MALVEAIIMGLTFVNELSSMAIDTINKATRGWLIRRVHDKYNNIIFFFSRYRPAIPKNKLRSK
ncbi:hypothetical protein ACMYSK_05910 [Klebsiella sp. I138]|uniref:hypothetical protein n=1 Tax=Klebsiella sp. I138 TaxID=2755385 RepID=UPI003DA875D2